MFEVFKAEVDKAKRLQGLTNADIAEKTGFKKSTIDYFMTNPESKGRDDSRKVAEAISKVLGIEL